jgi:23S rRNA pseudouridine1911/1915/1917 synthase
LTTPPTFSWKQLEVLHQDNHVLVVNKPAGLPTMGAGEGVVTLLELAKQYIKERFDKPGNVYLGTVSRLDAPVTGAVLFARTSKAAARLSAQFRERSVDKLYWAVVERAPEPPSGEWEDWMQKDERHRLMHGADAATPGAQHARLGYRLQRRCGPGWLVEVDLHTGRKHQIRLQFSLRGLPVWGDRKYGSHRQFSAGIALHARQITFQHPTLGTPVTVVAPIPASWSVFGM